MIGMVEAFVDAEMGGAENVRGGLSRKAAEAMLELLCQ
jgi:hypothetical protein